MRKIVFLLGLMVFLSTDVSFAAGLIYRQQQMKAMKQQQEQEEYQQHLQQQQQASQSQGQQAGNAEQTYQQTIDQRNQDIAKAIAGAHHQEVSSESAGNVPAAASQVSPQVDKRSSDVKDVVDLSEVWKKLDTKSTVWTLLIDDDAKLLTVIEYINRFDQEGVKINAPPAHYVQMVDQAVEQNPAVLQRPFGELIQMLAIIDYDFDNGMDKDALARKVLGDAGYEANKKRFTQQQSSGANE